MSRKIISMSKKSRIRSVTPIDRFRRKVGEVIILGRVVRRFFEKRPYLHFFPGLVNQVALIKDGLAQLSPSLYRTEVAIIGGGATGLTAAFELMKAGLNPVIFEANEGRLGGRMWTAPFEKDPNAIAELGAMRIPKSHQLFWHYVQEFELESKPFNNPLSPNSTTCLYIGGERVVIGEYGIMTSLNRNCDPDFYQGRPISIGFAEKVHATIQKAETSDGKLVFTLKVDSEKEEMFRLVCGENGEDYQFEPADKNANVLMKKHNFPETLTKDTADNFIRVHFYDGESSEHGKIVDEISAIQRKWSAMVQGILNPILSEGNPKKMKEKWQGIVQKYDKKNLKNMLDENEWTRREIDIFGKIGIGSGGFDSFFHTAFLEILRVELLGDEVEQRGIVGGTSKLIEKLWEEQVVCAGCEKKRSLKDLHDANHHNPYPKVTKMAHQEDATKPNKIRVTTSDGKCRTFPAAILTPPPPVLLTSMDLENILSPPLKGALQNINMVSAAKVFIRTRTAFWKGSEYKLHTTITDLPMRQLYLFDKDDFGTETESGVICLSYTWEDSARGMAALSPEEKVDMCLRNIAEIYGPKMRKKIESEIEDREKDIQIVDWDSVPGAHGAFRMAYNSQSMALANLNLHLEGNLEGDFHNGVFVAGEAFSQRGLSGWIDGAMSTGLDAGRDVIKFLEELRSAGRL